MRLNFLLLKNFTFRQSIEMLPGIWKLAMAKNFIETWQSLVFSVFDVTRVASSQLNKIAISASSVRPYSGGATARRISTCVPQLATTVFLLFAQVPHSK